MENREKAEVTSTSFARRFSTPTDGRSSRMEDGEVIDRMAVTAQMKKVKMATGSDGRQSKNSADTSRRCPNPSPFSHLEIHPNQR